MDVLFYDYAVECFIGGITSPPNAQAVLLKEFLQERKERGWEEGKGEDKR